MNNSLENYLMNQCHLDQESFNKLIKDEINTTPWYITLITGIAAWIGSIFFIGGILGTLGFFVKGVPGLIIATIALIAAVALSRTKYLKKYFFLEHFNLSAYLIALGILVAKLAFEIRFLDELILLFTGIWQAIMSYFFKTKTSQYINLFIAMVSFGFYFLFEIKPYGIIYFATLLYVITVCFMLFRERFILLLGANRTEIFTNVFLLSFLILKCGLTIFESLIIKNSPYYMEKIVFWTYPLAIISTVSLGSILIKFSDKIKINKIVLFIFYLIFSFLMWKSPDITSFTTLLILSFYLGSKFFTGLTIAGLIYFISCYYYYLGQTLLMKSLLLIGVGLLALVGAYFYNKKVVKIEI